jgi:hypothetical protein
MDAKTFHSSCHRWLWIYAKNAAGMLKYRPEEDAPRPDQIFNGIPEY